MMLAAEKGQIDAVKVLLEKGADINAHTQGITATMLAAQNGHTGVVKVLSDSGAPTSIPKIHADLPPRS